MIRCVLASLMLFSLAACVSLPGSNSGAQGRYLLQAAGGSCERGERALSLTVVKASAGLDTDQIARRDENTGAVSYLQGVRWIEPVPEMLEQRLAADLECRGYSVITSHHRTLGHEQLVCEIRAFNLAQNGAADQAEVALSCVLFAGGEVKASLITEHTVALQRWSEAAAMSGFNQAWQQVFADLSARLP